MSPPLVSVITVVFNDVANLEATILSVLDQQYDNVEYIVVDGGSTDGTVDLIRKYEDRIDHWISEPDKGIYDAMNKGVEMATGDWINLMNCGDRFASPGALSFFRDLHTEADIVYGRAIVEYPTFKGNFGRRNVSTIWKEMPFSHQAAFVRSGLLKSYKFDLKYRFSADYDFMFRAFVHGKKFLFVDQVICFFDFKKGASRGNKLRSLGEMKKSSLTHQFKVGRWLYLSAYLFYIRITLGIKRIIGRNATEWITRLLRG